VKKNNGRGVMKGWIYRRAMNLKDFGERLHPKFIGRFVRDIGLAIRDWVLDHSTVDEVIVTAHGGRDEYR
jgi:hypothetical protein